MKEFNPIHLSRVIVHWLNYQNLCGRDELFSEGFMSQPIGEYSLSLGPDHFQPEQPYPEVYQNDVRRKRSIDFALYKLSQSGTQKVLAHAIETKFITAKRQFMQEAYDDLYRLLWFQPTREPASCKRWLVIAGYHKNIAGKHLLASTSQIGKGKGKNKVKAFRGLLSADLNNASRKKPVEGAVPELRKLWVEAAEAFGQNKLPDSITVRLAARYPAKPKPTDLCCMVWEVERPQPDFASVHPSTPPTPPN